MVEGPDRGLREGDKGEFRVFVKGWAETKPLEFEWTISQGKIIKGQGTSSIQVKSKDTDESVTATVEVGGLPMGCANDASETTSPIDEARVSLIEEYGNITWLSERLVIVNIAKVLKENPNSHIYWFLAANDKESAHGVRIRARKIVEEISTLGEDYPARLRFMIHSASGSTTKVYEVPAGASAPVCGDDCVTFDPSQNKK